MRALVLVLLLVLPAGCIETLAGCSGTSFGAREPAFEDGAVRPGTDGQVQICDTWFTFDDEGDRVVATSVEDPADGWMNIDVVLHSASGRAQFEGETGYVELEDGVGADLGAFGTRRIHQGDSIRLCLTQLVVGPVDVTLRHEGPGGGEARSTFASLAMCEPIVHAFHDCDELDFYRTVPYSTAGLGPFRPVAADPAGRTMNLLYTAMRCKTADGSLVPVEGPTAIFSILVVEPLKGYEIAGAAGYQLVRALTTDNPELVRDWAPFGVVSAQRPLALEFSQAPGAGPKSRAVFSVDSPQHAVSGESTMAGTPTPGKAGVMGLYTLLERKPFVHRVEFSDYNLYGRGSAVLRPGLAGAPANVVPAYHNVDYSVSFLLDRRLALPEETPAENIYARE